MHTDKVHLSITELRKKKQKAFALLIDPDKTGIKQMAELAEKCNDHRVDYVFLGGSLMTSNHLDECILSFKEHSDIPVVLFPGNPSQLSKEADALLYLSLISGRNPDLLIGAHVVSAPKVKESNLEVISTGYMVIDGGVPTAVSYMSHSFPIPHDKNDIAVCTAMAGEFQGKHVIYMDAGSGAKNPITHSMVTSVRNHVQIPIIVGGGIRNPEKAYEISGAGADIVVVGNAIEKDPNLIQEMADAIHQVNTRVI